MVGTTTGAPFERAPASPEAEAEVEAAGVVQGSRGSGAGAISSSGLLLTAVASDANLPPRIVYDAIPLVASFWTCMFPPGGFRC